MGKLLNLALVLLTSCSASDIYTKAIITRQSTRIYNAGAEILQRSNTEFKYFRCECSQTEDINAETKALNYFYLHCENFVDAEELSISASNKPSNLEIRTRLDEYCRQEQNP